MANQNNPVKRRQPTPINQPKDFWDQAPQMQQGQGLSSFEGKIIYILDLKMADGKFGPCWDLTIQLEGDKEPLPATIQVSLQQSDADGTPGSRDAFLYNLADWLAKGDPAPALRVIGRATGYGNKFMMLVPPQDIDF